MPPRDISGFEDIGIIGVGRFGSYFAGQLERVGHRVHRADVRDASGERNTALAQACASSVVIYAVPIREFERALVESTKMLGPDAVVVDVCSVKIIPCAILERHLPNRAIVGTHPLFGPQSAPVSCAGQRIAVCVLPGDRPSATGEAAAARVERLFRTLELDVVRCTPAEHDAQVARTQFLTHFIGRGAVRAGIDRLPLSTRSHDALMDIVDVVGNDSTELFEDMAAFNPMASVVRAEFLAALRAIDGQLTARERDRHGVL